MTLHTRSGEVGVRELHDRLSEYLQRVEEGQEVLITRRGRPIVRLSAVEPRDPLAELASELWGASRSAATSILAYPEGCAALAAALRRGRLNRRQHARALAAGSRVRS